MACHVVLPILSHDSHRLKCFSITRLQKQVSIIYMVQVKLSLRPLRHMIGYWQADNMLPPLLESKTPENMIQLMLTCNRQASIRLEICNTYIQTMVRTLGKENRWRQVSCQSYSKGCCWCKFQNISAVADYWTWACKDVQRTLVPKTKSCNIISLSGHKLMFFFSAIYSRKPHGNKGQFHCQTIPPKTTELRISLTELRISCSTFSIKQHPLDVWQTNPLLEW